jgi:hypothetical protein
MQILRKLFQPFQNVFLLLACGILLSSQTADNREYQIKSVFLFNFTQFVTWPENAFPSAQAPFVIGILGNDPFGNYLKEAVSGEKVNGHPLLIERYTSPDQIKNCHILFITANEVNKTQELATKLKNEHVLTVSDANHFLKQGGMIRFFNKNNKIQIQINQEATKAAELTISSKLLRLADIFTP